MSYVDLLYFFVFFGENSVVESYSFSRLFNCSECSNVKEKSNHMTYYCCQIVKSTENDIHMNLLV